jgi:ABC-type uncharacterized transport system substrate-binding protein
LNIDIVTRYADADISRLAVLADELVRSQPDVIVAIYPPAALAVKEGDCISSHCCRDTE